MRLAILEVRFSSSMNWHFLNNFAESIRGLRVAAFKISTSYLLGIAVNFQGNWILLNSEWKPSSTFYYQIRLLL